MWDSLLFFGIKRRVVYVLFFGYFLLHKQKKVTRLRAKLANQLKDQLEK